jgi:ribosomal protein L7/L12
MTPIVLSLVAVAVVTLWRWNQVTMVRVREEISLVSQDQAGVRILIAQDQLIAAIRLTRDITGLDLKEAKELVEAMRHGTAVDFDALPSKGLDGLLAAAKDGEIHALLRHGDKIGAIKRWRALTGASLAEAHDAIETLARGLSGPAGPA